MSRFRLSLALVVVLAVAVGATGASAETGKGVVHVPKGQAVQIAVVLDTSEPIGPLYVEGIRNAVKLAVSEHPTIRGFPIQLNETSAPCLPSDAPALNAAAAQTVVANTQNVAVLGHIDRAELAEAVRDTKGFCGVTGKVSLDDGGYRINAPAPC